MAVITESYETVVLLSMTLGEEGIAALTEKIKGMISSVGTIDSIDEWGKRRLAYAINDETEGHYVLINFTAPVDFPAELERVFNITDGILRTLIVKKVNN